MFWGEIALVASGGDDEKSETTVDGVGFVVGDTKIGGRASGLDRPSASTAFAEVERACQRGSKADAAQLRIPQNLQRRLAGRKHRFVDGLHDRPI